MPRHRMRRAPSPCQAQRGVVLLVALMVLLVITTMSASIMRGSIGAETVVNNVRVQALAEQSAMVGLRYCEAQLPVRDTALPAAAADGTPRWRTLANWTGASVESMTVPIGWMVSANSSYTMGRLPECLMERTLFDPSVFVITARGFSPEYTEDAQGHTLAGSAVWLQSTVRLQ